MSANPDSEAALSPPDLWWNAVGERRLLLFKCPTCSTHWVPWSPTCPECGPRGGTPEWVESCGDGTLYSWVVIRHSVRFPDETPFVVGSVLLQEGAMLYGRVRADPDMLVGDMAVTASYAERGGRTVVDFSLREHPAGASGR